MSVALLINYRGFKAFFGGDIHAHTEGKIAQRDLVLDVDYYKGDHHGSHTSSSLAFMTDLKPSVVVPTRSTNTPG
jgi:beta-lactamase superfamily II metal-dependent hydrolase